MRVVLILFFVISLIFGRDYIYFLPEDGNEAEKKMVSLFSKAHSEIKIAIYSFTNRKFLKALKQSARRGVKIKIVADYESNKNQQHKSIVPILRKLRNVHVKLRKGIGKKYKVGDLEIATEERKFKDKVKKPQKCYSKKSISCNSF